MWPASIAAQTAETSSITAASAASTGSSDAQTAAATTASAAASGAQAAGTDTQDAGKDNYDYMAHQPQLPDGVVSTLYGNDGLMQIVCIGDSQYANFKGADGLGALLSHYCKANVFNLGLGGATAAVTPTEGSASASRSGGRSGITAMSSKAGAAAIQARTKYLLPRTATREVFLTAVISQEPMFL